MAYETHSSAQVPDDPETVIWRYMDFTKFVSLLHTRALFFPKLATLDDKFEGLLTRPVVDKIMKVPADADRDAFVGHMKRAGHSLGTFSLAKQLLFVSSWHMNPHESAAMWRLYLKSDEGLAIRSTFSRFRDSIKDARPVAIGVVKYLDYDTDEIDWQNVFNLGLHKRMSFEHEREIRGIIMDPGVNARGTSVAVDLEVLVDEVYVAPTTPSWFAEVVQSVLGQYGVSRAVRRSKLGEDPLY
jgi:hypothetical protein